MQSAIRNLSFVICSFVIHPPLPSHLTFPNTRAKLYTVPDTIPSYPDPMTQRDVWLEIRRLLLALVDLIERWCEISPRTKEIREWYKRHSA